MQYIDNTGTSSTPILCLVHGSWQAGRCWSTVQRHLAVAGIDSIAPTLPGHRDGDDRLAVTHGDYVNAVIAALDQLGEPAVLVGHSFGGSVISRVAELRPADCRGLVYYSAFVPRDGERVADSLPAQFIEFLNRAAAAREDKAIELPDQALWEAFANTANEQTLARIRALIVPEPYRPIFEPLALPAFPSLRIPAVYISCREDRTMPPGTFDPGQSSRLIDAELIEIDGDHMSLLTASQRLADALLEAVDLIDAASRIGPTEADNDRDAA